LINTEIYYESYIGQAYLCERSNLEMRVFKLPPGGQEAVILKVIPQIMRFILDIIKTYA